MANKKKKNKYPQSQIRAQASRYVIKGGEYNGAEDSSAFMVSGHSTGSPYSEMEELSEQLTRDVGGRPYQAVEFANDQGETGYDGYQGEGLGDLGGPELYGNNPSLLKKSPIHHAGTSRGLAIGAAVALGATALLGGLAFFFRQAGSTAPRKRSSAATRTGALKTGHAATSKAASKSTSKNAAKSASKRKSPKAKRASASSTDSSVTNSVGASKSRATRGARSRTASNRLQ